MRGLGWLLMIGLKERLIKSYILIVDVLCVCIVCVLKFKKRGGTPLFYFVEAS